MISMRLSDKAVDICKDNYGSHKVKHNGCDRCPLHNTCASGKGDYKIWLAAVNQASDMYKKL